MWWDLVASSCAKRNTTVKHRSIHHDRPLLFIFAFPFVPQDCSECYTLVPEKVHLETSQACINYGVETLKNAQKF